MIKLAVLMVLVGGLILLTPHALIHKVSLAASLVTRELCTCSIPSQPPSNPQLFLCQVARLLARSMSPSLMEKIRAIQEETRFAWNNSHASRTQLAQQLRRTYESVPHADLLLTAASTLAAAWLLRRSLHRYKNVNDLPLHYFERQRRLHGLAVSVNDSDNLRFYHQPHLLHALFRPNLARQDLKYHTINVRLAGIDAPEMAHFGSKTQPYAVEAKDWLTSFIQGRRVVIQLHRIDQYGRAVASVWVRRRRFPHLIWPVWWNVSLEMAAAGFATVYRDAGAEYGAIKRQLEEAEQRAKRLRLGMWQQSPRDYQSPGDYKRMNRLNAALNTLKTNGMALPEPSSRVNFVSQSPAAAPRATAVGGK